MTPSAETLLSPPPSTRLFDARQKPNSNHTSQRRRTVCKSQTGHARGLGGWSVCVCPPTAFVPGCWVAAAASPGLPSHAQYPATTSSAACQETRQAGVQQQDFPAVRAQCCCCCCCCRCAVQVGRQAGEISAIPPHPQITAVQESHCPPTGVAQRAVPEWKDRGGGVRRWDQDDERPILGAGLILALGPPRPASLGCRVAIATVAAAAAWCVCVCAPGFGFLGGKRGKQTGPKPTGRRVHCNTTQRTLAPQG